MPPIRDVDFEDFDGYVSDTPSLQSEDGFYEPSSTRQKRFKKGKRTGKTRSYPTAYSRLKEARSSSISSVTLVEDGEARDADALEKALRPPHEPITVCGIELRPTVAFDTFWRVVAERQAMDDRRRAGQPAPWTEDPILRDHHFCNTFRVLDKGCQYLIREVIQKGPQSPVEVVFRVVLFDLFTKIGTWELLQSTVGPLTWKTYNRDRYAEVLMNARREGTTLYTGAFIKPAPKFGFKENFMNHLCFLEMLMENQLPLRLLGAKYLDDVYEYLMGFPSMGPFTAYQLMLGLSYTNVLNFNANDFAVAGPGSISGANKLFGKTYMTNGRAAVQRFDEEVMRYMVEHQDFHFKRLGIQFPGLGPKKLPMTIVDVEHMLCEVDKYCRVAHKQFNKGGKRTQLNRKFKQLGVKTLSDEPMVLPKAWSKRDRAVPRIRPERTLRIETRYEVERILNHRDAEQGRQYLVRWVGYAPKFDTWEFECSLLDDAPATVHEYKEKLEKGLL